MTKTWALLVNSAAGRRARGVADALEAFQSRGLRPHLLEPRSPSETSKMAGAWARREAVFSVYGGDGTLNLVASALAGGRASLAPLPGGTENVLCRELGISLSPGLAALSLAQGQRRSWDLGRLGGRVFVMVGGVGLDAEVCARALGLWKKTLGRAGFALSAAAAFMRRPRWFSGVGGRRRHEGCWQAVFSNGRRYGGGIPFNPQARPDDGRLDAALLRRGPAGGRLFQGLGLLATGGFWGADRARIRSARIESPLRLAAHVDGEPFEADNPLVSINASALWILGPRPREARK